VRGALILDLAVGGQPLLPSFISGTCVDADLHFYPGNYPLRARIKNRYETTRPTNAASFYSKSEQLMKTYAEGLSRNPWLESIPAPIDSIVPVRLGDRWFARDSEQKLLPISSQSNVGWQLASISGGHPILITGEWNGRSLLPLGAWADGRYIEL